MANNKGKKIVKPTFVSSLPPPIPAKLQKEVNELSRYFKKNINTPQKKLYVQASSLSKQSNSTSTSNITMKTLKLKEIFPNLPNNLVQKVINSTNNKLKPKINMTTKDLSQKQVIILMNSDLAKRFIKNSNMYIININYAFKTIRSNTIADFIHVKDKGIIIMTNNVSLSSDLQEIEKYVKNSLISDTEQVSLPRLPQSKSYLKIVEILYINEKTNSHISLDDIENILKNNHLFNNIILTFKPCVIKIFPKSDIAIIWVNI